MTGHVSKSTRTTANEPANSIDPGGTKPTKGRGGEAPPKPKQHVVSGNRNDGTHSSVEPTTPKPK